jgi:hypothetical protein
MFPRSARSIILDKSIKTVFDAMSSIYNEGFVNVTMVVGDDRLNEFDVLLNKYNGVKGRHGFYNFRKVSVISAGQRDPDAEGAEGASATKQREPLLQMILRPFSQGLPKAVSNADAKKIFNSVRKGLGSKKKKNLKIMYN